MNPGPQCGSLTLVPPAEASKNNNNNKPLLKTLLAPNQGCCFTSNTELSSRCVDDQQMPIHWLCTVGEGRCNKCSQSKRLQRMSYCLFVILFYSFTATVLLVSTENVRKTFRIMNNRLIESLVFKNRRPLSERWCCHLYFLTLNA